MFYFRSMEYGCSLRHRRRKRTCITARPASTNPTTGSVEDSLCWRWPRCSRSVNIWSILSMWKLFARNDGDFSRCSGSGVCRRQCEHVGRLAVHMLQMLRFSIYGVVEHLAAGTDCMRPESNATHGSTCGDGDAISGCCIGPHIPMKLRRFTRIRSVRYVLAREHSKGKPDATEASGSRSTSFGCGAGDGTRTHDILLGKQTLYQLSYTRNSIWYP